MTKIAINIAEVNQVAFKLNGIHKELASLKKNLSEANKELCANWTGQGAAAMQDISSLVDWYLDNLESMTLVESINLKLASGTLEKSDKAISMTINTIE